MTLFHIQSTTKQKHASCNDMIVDLQACIAFDLIKHKEENGEYIYKVIYKVSDDIVFASIHDNEEHAKDVFYQTLWNAGLEKETAANWVKNYHIYEVKGQKHNSERTLEILKALAS